MILLLAKTLSSLASCAFYLKVSCSSHLIRFFALISTCSLQRAKKTKGILLFWCVQLCTFQMFFGNSSVNRKTSFNYQGNSNWQNITQIKSCLKYSWVNILAQAGCEGSVNKNIRHTEFIQGNFVQSNVPTFWWPHFDYQRYWNSGHFLLQCGWFLQLLFWLRIS